MTSATTLTSSEGWAPTVRTFTPGDAVPDALILKTSTLAGQVEGDAPAVRVAYAIDAAAGFVPEGTDIPEADPGRSHIDVHTGKVSQLVRISRELWAQPGTPDMLSQSVQRAITDAANNAYLAQPVPTSPAVTPPAGLLNVAGIIAGEPLGANLDALVDLIATLESNKAKPSHIIIDPIGWAAISKLKVGTDSNSALLGAGTDDTERRLLGLPVIVTPAITANTGLVIDKTAVLSVSGTVQVATSEHQYFNSDEIALRATWRFGQNVLHPDRLGTFTVGA